VVSANGKSVLLEILCVLLAGGRSGGMIRFVPFRSEIKESINWRICKYFTCSSRSMFQRCMLICSH